MWELGGGGSETLSVCPASFQHLIFSLAAPPLKKGKSWACPTRGEEETLSLNPGNVCRYGGPEVVPVWDWTFDGKAPPSSFWLWKLAFTLRIFFIGTRGRSSCVGLKFMGQLLDPFLVGSHPGLDRKSVV